MRRPRTHGLVLLDLDIDLGGGLPGPALVPAPRRGGGAALLGVHIPVRGPNDMERAERARQEMIAGRPGSWESLRVQPSATERLDDEGGSDAG